MRCKSRLWEHLYILLFFVGCWLWLFLVQPYHISFKEETGAFIRLPGMFAAYMSKPAALSAFIGDFLTQFFWYRALGPMILCALFVLLWLGTAKALVRCGVERVAYLLALLPVAVEAGFVSYLNYPLSATVAFVSAVWLSVACMQRPSRNGFDLLAWVMITLSYSLLTGGQVITVLVLFLLYRRRVNWRILIVEILMLSGAILILGSNFELSPLGRLVYPVIPGYKLPALILLALGPVSVLLAGILGLSGFKPSYSAVLSCVALSVSLTSSFNSQEEYMVRMSVNAYRGHWNKVWTLAEDAPESMFFGTFYRDVCLARKSELPDRLLEFGQKGSDGMHVLVERGTDYLWLFASIDQLMEVGDIPQATGCALLCQTIMPGGNSTFALRRLSELAIISGDSDVAKKYLDMLSHTVVHRRWAEAMKDSLTAGHLPQELSYYQAIASKNDRLFLQSDWYGSLESLAATNPANRTAIDYLLCAHLLDKQLQSFVAEYDKYYLNRFDRLVHVPILYQEALVTGITDSESYRETVSKYQIDSDVTQRYSRFLEALDKSGGNVGELGEYKGTYWYYLVSNRLSSNNN